MKTLKFISGLIFTLLFFNTHMFSQANFWEPTNGPVGKRIWAMAIAPNGYIYSGTDVEGVYISTDGMNWNQKNSGLNSLAIRTIAVKPDGKVFVGTNGGIYLSVNNGDSWTQVNTGLTNVDIRAIGVAPNGDVFVGTWGGGVYKSTDNGTSWVAGNQDLYNTYIRSICINSSGTIFVGTSGGGVYRSSDGNQWATPSNYGNINVIALSLNTSGHIFAGTEGNGVFISIDQGNTWTPVNNGLTDWYLRTLIVNSANNYVYASTIFQGAFRTTDNGGSWFKMNSGLATPDVLSIVSSTGWIYAGTNGGGVYRSTIYTIPVLATDIETINFSATKDGTLPTSKIVEVYNLGTGTMAWATAKGSTWLNSTTPSSGTNNAAVNVSVNTTNLPPGTYTSSITITAPSAGNDNNGSPTSPKNISVNYTILGALINVLNNVDFANVLINTFKEIIVSISNNGNVPLVISNITKTGTDAAMFSLPGTSIPITIVAGATYDMIIRFTPTSEGIKSGALIFINNASNVTINLTGNVPSIVSDPLSLSQPINNSTGIAASPSLLWNSVSGAISYQLQVTRDTTGDTNFTSAIVNQSGITNTFYSVTGLQNSTSYFWRVRATNSAGPGYWSDVWKFTTLSTSNEISVRIPDTTVLQGTVLEIPVSVGDLTSRNILSYQFTVTSNSSVLQAKNEVVATNTLSNISGWSVTPNNNTNGQITVGGFGSTPLTGSGALVKLKFDVIGASGIQSPLSFSTFSFNSGSPLAVTTNGKVTVYQNILCGDASNDGIVNAYDAAKTLRHAIGLEVLTTQGQINADVNKDGIIMAFDAALILRKSIDLPMPAGVTTTCWVSGLSKSGSTSGNIDFRVKLQQQMEIKYIQ